jgi:hypothetical protein
MTMTTKYPDYARAVSLAERLAHELPTGWSTVTGVTTAGGRTVQAVIVGQEFTLDDSRIKDRPAAAELASVWSIVRPFAVGGIQLQTHDAGATLFIGGAA